MAYVNRDGPGWHLVSPVSDTSKNLFGTLRNNDPGTLLSPRAVECSRDERCDLARSCVSPEPRLFENRHSIQYNFEASGARWNQLDLRVGIPLPHLSRQTGGSRLVVSKSAVFDRDLHWILSLNFSRWANI